MGLLTTKPNKFTQLIKSIVVHRLKSSAFGISPEKIETNVKQKQQQQQNAIKSNKNGKFSNIRGSKSFIQKQKSGKITVQKDKEEGEKVSTEILMRSPSFFGATNFKEHFQH